jgi:hypothetical protein
LILVVSNVANESAIDLVETFSPGAASLVTASTLHRNFKAAVPVGNVSSAQLTIGGVRMSAAEITGVVSTIAYFLPQEFYEIETADREYVCAETRAFFVYLLAELRCKKINPPTSKSLSGLGLHRIEWMKAARGWGIPVFAGHLRNGLPVRDDALELPMLRATVIGDAIVEDGVPGRLRDYALALARAFEMPYLGMRFAVTQEGEYALADLSSVPDVSAPENRAAIVRFMEGTHG